MWSSPSVAKGAEPLQCTEQDLFIQGGGGMGGKGALQDPLVLQKATAKF